MRLFQVDIDHRRPIALMSISSKQAVRADVSMLFDECSSRPPRWDLPRHVVLTNGVELLEDAGGFRPLYVSSW